MQELGLQPEAAAPWFVTTPAQGYTRVSVPAEYAAAWGDLLSDAVRRCYISDAKLQQRAQATGDTTATVLEATLPDPGSVMSGDFGEIVGYIYLATREAPMTATGPKKWRLKQDRTKAAPCSDVVQFVLPNWPEATPGDRIICAEVKAKATPGPFAPIARAIEGSLLDQASRLTRTLVWLRERAITDGIGDFSLAQLNRFINATDHPPYIRTFHAIAVVCTNLVDQEIATLIPDDIPENCALVVLSVPELRVAYTTVYAAVMQSAMTGAVPPEVPA